MTSIYVSAGLIAFFAGMGAGMYVSCRTGWDRAMARWWIQRRRR